MAGSYWCVYQRKQFIIWKNSGAELHVYTVCVCVCVRACVHECVYSVCIYLCVHALVWIQCQTCLPPKCTSVVWVV